MDIRSIGRDLMIMRDALKVSLKETLLTTIRSREYKFSFYEARMLITAHSLEKGMGLINTRKGYGKKNAIKLCEALMKHQKIRPGSTDYCFVESFGILDAYVNYQEKEGVDILNIKVLFLS